MGLGKIEWTGMKWDSVGREGEEDGVAGVYWRGDEVSEPPA